MNEGERSGVPSGTTLRFASLVLLTIATTLFVFGQYANLTADNERCQVSSGLYLTKTYFADPDDSKWDAYRACLAQTALPHALWLFGGLVLLFAVSLLIYLVRPLWRIRMRKLVPAPEELHETLSELAAQAGLPHTTFLLDPASVRAGGAAFGNHRRKYVVLNAGMLALHRTDRPTFRAIVLHELAHVRSDVTITYATLALWRAFVVVVLAPFLVTRARSLQDAETAGLVARLTALAVLVFLARVAVLRAREQHADAFVARWTGSAEPYRVLAPSRWWRRWFGLHPVPAARSAAMRDPDSLLRPGFWEVLGCTAALQLAWWHTRAALQVLTWYRADNQSFLVLRAGWAVLITALIGLIAWRGAAFGARRGVFAWAGLALGLGLVLGDRLDGYNFDPVAVLVVIAWAVLVGTAVLVTMWAGYCATLVRTRWHGWFLGLSTAVVTFTLLGGFSEVRFATATWRDLLGPALETLRGPSPSLVDVVVVPFLLNSNRVLTVVSLALVWLVPLMLRREFPRAAAVSGAAGGVLAVAVVILLRTGTDPLTSTVRQVVAVVIVQFVVVLVASRWVDRVGALLVAWLIGLVATGAIWLTHLQGGAEVDSVLATRPHQVLPLFGTLAALAGSLYAVRRPQRQARPWGPIGLAVVSVAVASWWPKAPTAVPLLAPAPTSTPPTISSSPPAPATTTTSAPIDPAQALRIWKIGGGLERLAAVDQANAALWAETKPDNDTRLEAACAALAQIAGEEFPPPPDPRIGAMWTETLRSLSNGSEACLGAYRGVRPDDGTMARELIKGRDQLAELVTALR
ncbi:M48 family metalloprotease [Lentzea sp. NPDC004782]|uniref:M48 family metalloprotease n=1 Tax=Lentzea sp. NPDC004782 TaxID=3154458 RepID=UPI0033BAD3DE